MMKIIVSWSPSVIWEILPCVSVQISFLLQGYSDVNFFDPSIMDLWPWVDDFWSHPSRCCQWFWSIVQTAKEHPWTAMGHKHTWRQIDQLQSRIWSPDEEQSVLSQDVRQSWLMWPSENGLYKSDWNHAQYVYMTSAKKSIYCVGSAKTWHLKCT